MTYSPSPKVSYTAFITLVMGDTNYTATSDHTMSLSCTRLEGTNPEDIMVEVYDETGLEIESYLAAGNKEVVLQYGYVGGIMSPEYKATIINYDLEFVGKGSSILTLQMQINDTPPMFDNKVTEYDKSPSDIVKELCVRNNWQIGYIEPTKEVYDDSKNTVRKKFVQADVTTEEFIESLIKYSVSKSGKSNYKYLKQTDSNGIPKVYFMPADELDKRLKSDESKDKEDISPSGMENVIIESDRYIVLINGLNDNALSFKPQFDGNLITLAYGNDTVNAYSDSTTNDPKLTVTGESTGGTPVTVNETNQGSSKSIMFQNTGNKTPNTKPPSFMDTVLGPRSVLPMNFDDKKARENLSPENYAKWKNDAINNKISKLSLAERMLMNKEYNNDKYSYKSVVSSSSSVSQAEITSQSIFDAARSLAYPAELTLLGDPSLQVGRCMVVQVLTKYNTLHHSSGRYRIQSINDTISGGEFTSTLSLFREIGEEGSQQPSQGQLNTNGTDGSLPQSGPASTEMAGGIRKLSNGLVFPLTTDVKYRVPGRGGSFGAPRDGGRRRHAGQDYSCPTGSKLVAVADGTIIKTGRQSSPGNYINIRLSNGDVVKYFHLSSIQVSVGQTVKQGQIIGLSGNTGYSTGPHLHFEYHPGGGKAVDPTRYVGK